MWTYRSQSVFLLLFTLATASRAVAAPVPRPPSSGQPNLLFILPDQMRRQAMGFVGEDPVYTPNLDRFSTEGVYLSQATSTFPLCTPFRGMMMTGRFPNQTGIVNNANSSRPSVFLRPSERCFTDILHDAGYQVGYIGKWHLSHPHPPYLPQDGRAGDIKWDEYTPPEERHHIDFWCAYNAYDDHMRPRYWETDAPRGGFHYVDQWSPEHDADVAIKYLCNAGGKLRDPHKPFALWVSINPPHPPYGKVPARYQRLYDNRDIRQLLTRRNVPDLRDTDPAVRAVRDYFAAITGVDEQFGRILDTLRELGIEKNTIVIFTSDHGEMMGSHGLMSKPFPYEEAYSVPMLMRWPGHIAPGRVDDLLMSSPDLMPTLLGMMGLHAEIPAAVQGRDYSSLILQQNAGLERPAYAPYMDETDGGHRGVVTHRYTLVLGKNGEVNLYDNAVDPYQLQNVAERQPGLVRQLTAQTFDWMRRAGDAWTP